MMQVVPNTIVQLYASRSVVRVLDFLINSQIATFKVSGALKYFQGSLWATTSMQGLQGLYG